MREANQAESMTDKNNWIQDVDDARSLAEMAMPGTHGSVAFFGGDAYRCQTWPMKQQLEEGIRFLDIHVKKFGNVLYVYQWSSYQNILLIDIINIALNFLQTNPNECVLIRIWEDKIHMSDPGIWSLINEEVITIGKQHFWLKNEIPSIGDVRGKVVFLKNFNGSEMGIEHDLLQELQEACVPTLFHLADAWNNIEKQLQMTKNTITGKIHLSYCCGSSWGAYPCHVAHYFNSHLLEFLQKSAERIYGIIALDFPDPYLVEKIIECNF